MKIVNVFYELSGNQIIINLVKQVNGEKSVEKIHSDINPYFYTTEDVNSSLIINKDIIIAKNGTFYRNEVRIPQHVRLLREKLLSEGVETYEADILFSRRWYLDKGIDVGNERLKRLYLDTEASNPPTRFVNMEKDELLSISCVDENGKEFFFWRNDYTSEREMLVDFMKQVLDYSMIVGWNLRDFDMTYLATRFKANRLPIKFFRYFVWVDLMDLYKRFVTSYSKQQIISSYSLDNIARIELGNVHKVDKSYLWSRKRSKVRVYNMMDAKLVKMIDEKTKLTDLIEAFSNISNLLVDDCLNFSSIIEKSVMRDLKGKYIFSNRTNRCVPYSGAFVGDPPTGLLENVYVYDFSSMYPNIIRTFNISVETLDENGEIITPVGTRFSRQEGVYPRLVSRFLSLRKKYKKLLKETGDEHYNVLQIGCKFLSAAFYGVLGFGGSRLFNPQIAETITKTGRWYDLTVKKWFEDRGYKFVYADTDSVFIHGIKSIDDAIRLGEELNKFIEEETVEKFNVDKNYMYMKFEKVFGRIYFYGKKKRYFGRIIFEDGKKVDKFFARGLEIRRTDWCELAKEYEEELLKRLIDNVCLAYEYHKRFLLEIKKQPVEKFVIWKTLTRNINSYKNTPPHVRVATSNDFVGSKIGYVVTNYDMKKKRIVKVARYDEDSANKIKVDYNYYIQKQIMPIYRRLLAPLLQSTITKYIM